MIELAIDNSCIRCGQCVAVCPAHILKQADKKAEITTHHLETCIGCGHCVAICPTDSVQHSLFPADKVHEINKDILPSPDALMEILRKRRSNRAFSDKAVSVEFLDKILEAANLAPTGGNRQGLKYTLVTRPEVLKAVIDASMKIACGILADFDEEKNPFLYRVLNNLKVKYEAGADPILRDAKTLIIIHADGDAAADANLAYQNGSLMAEALDVAHFYTGYIRILAMYDTTGLIKGTMGITGSIFAGMALSMPKYTFKKYVDKNEIVVDRIV